MRIKWNSLYESLLKTNRTCNEKSNVHLLPGAVLARGEDSLTVSGSKETLRVVEIFYTRLFECIPLSKLIWRLGVPFIVHNRSL